MFLRAGTVLPALGGPCQHMHRVARINEGRAQVASNKPGATRDDNMPIPRQGLLPAGRGGLGWQRGGFDADHDLVAP